MNVAILLLVLAGHGAICVGLVNRGHAIGLSQRMVHALNAVGLVGLAALPVGIAAWSIAQGTLFPGPRGWTGLPNVLQVYLVLCGVVAPASAVRWAWLRWAARPPHVLRSHKSRTVRLVPPRGAEPSHEDHLHHFLVHLPGNETLNVDFAERVLDVPRLHATLDGLSIMHLSDLHFTGRVGKAFFADVVDLVLAERPELVAITGDLVDTNPCIDWVPDTLGRLRAPCGVFFILGNHDRRVDTARLRRVLVDAGLVDLGGRWVQITARGQPIVLAGNELPWLPPAADLSTAPPRGPDGQPLRIVLSHSPDQLDWARANDVDLILAGPLHGGQIRLPLLGPVLSPSHRGIRYSSGTFYQAPTILHVNRGLSGELPLRLNCPPEIARLVLKAGGNR